MFLGGAFAPAIVAKRVALLMHMNPGATKTACAACVNAEEAQADSMKELLAAQQALTVKQKAADDAQGELTVKQKAADDAQQAYTIKQKAADDAAKASTDAAAELAAAKASVEAKTSDVASREAATKTACGDLHEHTSKYKENRTLLMKLKAGSSVFKYDSAYWENDQLLNQGDDHADEGDDADVKTAAFLNQALTGLEVCYGTLDNCFEYRLGREYASARDVFKAGWLQSRNLGSGDLSEDDARRAFTDVFLPPGSSDYDIFWNGGSGKKCRMQRPGINTQCNGNNWARIGYCTNVHDQPCQPDDANDADSPVGIGLKTQSSPGNVNAPFGVYQLEHGNPTGKYKKYQKQAWLFALK